jgi:DNA-binding MurR/RpiR family transcriptional regulator
VQTALHASERRVVEAILANPSLAVESTAQEVADRVGVARSSVVRTCQRLGYAGYPQLRVALARELALATAPDQDYGTTALGRIRAAVDGFAQALPQLTAMLSEEDIEQAIALVLGAGRVLAVANGLSGPLASDVSMRLTAAGRPAEFVADPIAQQISASQLSPGGVCLVISGSGSNQATLSTTQAARSAGAAVIAVTSFARSPLVNLADVALVVPPTGGTFRHELEHTSRVAHALLLEALVEVVSVRLGDSGRQARATVLSILSGSLGD